MALYEDEIRTMLANFKVDLNRFELKEKLFQSYIAKKAQDPRAMASARRVKGQMKKMWFEMNKQVLKVSEWIKNITGGNLADDAVMKLGRPCEGARKNMEGYKSALEQTYSIKLES